MCAGLLPLGLRLKNSSKLRCLGAREPDNILEVRRSDTGARDISA